MTHPRIGIVGPMMSGKTTLAQILALHHGFTRIALADPVKNGAVAMLNALKTHIGRAPDMTRAKLDADKVQLRPLLQITGTEIGRQYLGPDTLWIDLFLEAADRAGGPVVCDDVRFGNEASALLAAGFEIYRVERDHAAREADMLARYGSLEEVTKVMAHPSELEALTLPVSGVIRNREGADHADLVDAAARIALGAHPVVATTPPGTALLVRDHDGDWTTLFVDGFHRDGNHSIAPEELGSYLVEHRIQTFKKLSLEAGLGRYPAVLEPHKVDGVFGGAYFDLPEEFDEVTWDALVAAAE